MKLIIQFGYRYDFDKVPQGVPIVDCRVINNPRKLRNNPELLYEAVSHHPAFDGLVDTGVKLLLDHDMIAVGCEFGKHRSGVVAKVIRSKVLGSIVEIEKLGK